MTTKKDSKAWILSLVVMSVILLLICGNPGSAAGAPKPKLPGCTRMAPNGKVFGLQSTTCSNLLPELECVLVSDGVDTVDAGRFAGTSFGFDVECQESTAGSSIYHFESAEMIYKAGINNYDGTHDTFIRPDHPDSIMPPNVAMEVVSNKDLNPWIRGVVRFTTQQVLNEHAKVLRAELTMVCQEAVPPGGVPGHLLGGGMNVSIYGLLKEFEQGEATWNHYASGLAWEVPGAEGTSDRFTIADDTQFILTKCDGVGTDPSDPTGGDIVPAPYTWNVTVSFLAQIDQGIEEYGWVFFTPDDDEDSVRFFTHEMSAENAPELVIIYVE
jgi:hypothetical protein